MKVFVIVILLSFGLSSCKDQKIPVQGDTEFQKELNAVFKDASTTPLKRKDQKEFEGLEFFKYDSTYVVKALFTRTENERPFKMKTSTDSLQDYVKYGVVEFSLKGERYQLNMYQNLELITQEGYEDYLFLPFLDETNGMESYGGGRYIELRTPQSNTITIDFNSAYNPYCAYNEKYSCPLVPRENYLKTRIEAGVKVFKNH
tara:strand:- start:7952 stop:8557 length:606 start_codon:yes stop_codon:yes gene_type:complete